MAASTKPPQPAAADAARPDAAAANVTVKIEWDGLERRITATHQHARLRSQRRALAR